MYTGVSTPKHKYILEDGTEFDIRRGLDTKAKVVDKIKIDSKVNLMKQKLIDFKKSHEHIFSIVKNYNNTNHKKRKIIKQTIDYLER